MLYSEKVVSLYINIELKKNISIQIIIIIYNLF